MAALVCQARCVCHAWSNAQLCLSLSAVLGMSIFITANTLLCFNYSPWKLLLLLWSNKEFLSSFPEEYIDDIKLRHMSNSAIQQYFLITEISIFAINPLILAFCWIDVAVTLGTGSGGVIFWVDKWLILGIRHSPRRYKHLPFPTFTSKWPRGFPKQVSCLKKLLKTSLYFLCHNIFKAGWLGSWLFGVTFPPHHLCA